MVAVWIKFLVPLLRCERFQIALLEHGDLKLRLKLNSHWIFSDIAYSVHPGPRILFLPQDEELVDEIDPLIGVSPQLLNFIANVTWASCNRQESGSDASPGGFEALEGIKQRVPLTVGSPSREWELLEDIAESHWHAAYIYFLCRYQR